MVQFTVDVEILKDTMVLLGKTVGVENSFLEELRNIRIEAADEMLSMVGTNLNISGIMRVKEGVTVTTGGSIVTNYSAFSEIVKVAKGAIVVRESEAGLRIVNKNTVWNLATLPVANFPPVPQNQPDKPTIEINTGMLINALSSVYPAVSDDMARPSMCQVRFKNGLAIGGDGTRVHAQKTTGLDDVDFGISRAAVMPLISFLKSGPETITLQLSTEEAEEDILTIGNREFAIKPVAGNFIDLYEGFVLPALDNFSTQFTTNRSALLEQFLRVRTVAEQGGVKVSIKDGILTLTAGIENTVETSMDVEDKSITQAETGYTLEFIVDALKSASSKEVTIKFSDGKMLICTELLTVMVLPLY